MKDHVPRAQMNQTPESLFANFGFSNLTEIQKKASPIILQKKDCLVIAPTGSGKTECSVIPIFSLLTNSKKAGKIKALYITPLRALNRDVFRRITKYAHQNKLSIEIRHGDTSQKDRKKITENPPDVLITTPETLVILLTQIKYLDALSDLEWIIIDEVHELLSSERGTQLSLSVERLEFNSKFPLTKIGLSATVGNFEEAGKFVVGTKRKCEIIRDTSVRKYDVEIKYVDGTISDVAEKIVEHVSELNLDSPVLLFTNTRGESEFLASILKEKSNIPIELHHGSLSKEVREETEQNLREGKRGIVVCTSSLELGLDIGSVELVIHYGSPRQVSKLVQRIGRSRHNRNASAKGLIITNNSDDEFEAQAILQRIQEGSIEEQKIHDGSLDVLAHHLVGLTMQIGEISIDKAFDLIIGAYPFRNLKLEELVDVLDLLDSNYLIFFDRTNMTFWKKGRSFKYYFENLSTIPDILKFKVFDSVGKKIIGTLDQRFVGDYGDSGNIFVLKGSQWRILNVDEKSFTVNVEPFRGGGITVPYWEGENIPIDYKTARKVGNFRSKVRKGLLQLTNKTIEKLNFDEISDDDNIIIESSRSQGSIVIHSCFGTKINSTLSTLLSSMLSSVLGSVVDSRSDGYRIAISSRSRISEKLFLEVLKDDYDLFSMITASLAGTHNVNWRTWCVAKKFGIVGRGAIYERKSARFLYERYSKTALVHEALRELFHDKYDLKNTDKLLKEIREDQIHIKWLEVDQFSKLAEPILDHTSKYYSSPANLDKGILDLVKTRLEKTKHRLICARCGKWERVVETNEVKNILICPYCKGRQITATFYSDYDLPKIIRKKYEGKKLTSEEKHKADRAWKVSSLVENFGKTAIIVMSGYGVGADTAARILRNMVDEEHLLKQIYEAERQYVVTRGFWDS
ncbi:DEAD/DEAH box helicase [Candidatus Nitrosopumilus koreensis AR1]|uniref:DEAD/DEAH box helicase n=1 Tax=Candidatus Nitrosopumilus koreensis AR1 TaxID=1229908 RepID=K0B1T7_9ARCH|nr:MULTISPECIES: DEAD/DEAH box helicase [Nitrosopumilus]AFS79963.1 DEAD/DEAH box helicase [Candidatus Nitrosopumilus koreensis AR1]